MKTLPTSAVIEYLISRSMDRVHELKYGSPANPSPQYVDIFDELDSLEAKEFAEVYSIYLLGSGSTAKVEKALQLVLDAGFAPLEAVAGDPLLHQVLSKGIALWGKDAQKS